MKKYLKSLSLAFLAAVLSNSAVADQSYSYNNPSLNENFRNGSTLVEYEMYEEAIRYLKQAEIEEPKNADTKNLIAYSYRKLGQYRLAYQYYQQALQLNPKHRGAHEYLGELYVNIKRLDKAQQELAVLEKLCSTSCPEYKKLQKAIDEYKASAAKGSPEPDLSMAVD
ncbi:MAG TPA: tetratricopeptide repeat protein [Gammaproteobacteria bacterium]|nr:tetratricopeptide repeat protein [Gammaproteobacteria bacterium]